MNSVFAKVTLIIFLWGMGILILPFLMDDVTNAQDVNHLDCDNSSISNGVKINCLFTYSLIPYYIWFLVSIVMAYFLG